MKLKQERGQLTQRIKDKSKKLLGYKITKEELRLMPYVQYCLINEQQLDAEKISKVRWYIIEDWKWKPKSKIEEAVILTKWEKKDLCNSLKK